DVICVGATQNDGEIASFSNFGSHVDVFAPGDFILSTYPMTLVPGYSQRGFEILSGTSQASPLVAAMAALLNGLHPNESVAQIRRRVFSARDKHKKVRLDRMFAAHGGQSLRLVFKDTSVISLEEGNQFQVPIQFENLGDTVNELRLDVQTLVSGHH